MKQNELREVWELYELTGDAEPLAVFVETHGDSLLPCTHEYPQHHRICEVPLRGRMFCVTRCIECDERLAFKPTNMTHDAPGVPYWLQGGMLAKWVADETASPAKGPIDWERYRNDLSSPGRVSLWLGSFPDRASFDAYLDDTAYYAGEESTSVNRFAADFRTDYYDHDFQEGYFCEQGALPLNELLNGISYVNSFLARAVEAAEKAGWRSATAFVLIYDFDYSRNPHKSPGARMAFIGTFDYRKT